MLSTYTISGEAARTSPTGEFSSATTQLIQLELSSILSMLFQLRSASQKTVRGGFQRSMEGRLRFGLAAFIMHINAYEDDANIDDALLQEAARLSGIAEKTAVVRAGLEALIARESARRLAALGGSEPGIRQIRRRRPQPRRTRVHAG